MVSADGQPVDAALADVAIPHDGALHASSEAVRARTRARADGSSPPVVPFQA
jgi:hypothetical protein